MALTRVPQLTLTQRVILDYSRMSQWALGLALFIVVAVFFLLQQFALRAWEAALTTAATALIVLVLWRRFDNWCAGQILCPVCKRSLLQRFWIEVWVGFWCWVGGIASTCRHCGARLP